MLWIVPLWFWNMLMKWTYGFSSIFNDIAISGTTNQAESMLEISC